MKRNLLLCLFLVVLQVSCKEDILTKEESSAPGEENITSSATSEMLLAIHRPSLDETKKILKNATGYNPRNFIYTNPWTNTALDQKFQLGLVNSEANMIRYPGGTFGNFWNYRTDKLFRRKSTLDPGGWVNLNKVENTRTHRFIENDNAKINSVDDLKYAAKGGASGKMVKVVFVMNMVTPGKDFYEWKWGRAVNGNVGSADWYDMLDDRYNRFKDMLLRAKGGTDPIEVRFIELGNEYYFPHAYCVEAFPTGAAFGTACNYIANKLINDAQLNLPATVRIAATASCVGGGDNRKGNWNSSLASTLNKNKVGYVTMHAYKAYDEPANYNETSFQTKLVDWYQATNQKFVNSGADANFISQNWRIWFTETNANWDASVTENTPSSEARWAQNLVDAYSVLHLYDRANATLVLQFQFNNQVVPNTNGSLYNRAKALIPYMKASNEATSAARISFAGTNMPKLPNSPKAVVQGYCFINAGGKRKAVIMNLSGSLKKLNLNQVFPNANTTTLSLEAYNNPTIDGTGTPHHYNLTFPKTEVNLRPYSVNYVRAQ